MKQTGDYFNVTIEFLSVGEQARDMEFGAPLPADGPSRKLALGDRIKATQRTPLLTSIARMSPSPDWFTGFSSVDLRQKTNRADIPLMWYREFSIDSYPLTAGTMSGQTYTDRGAALNPREGVRQFTATSAPASATKVLLNPTGKAIVPVARWSCRFLN